MDILIGIGVLCDAPQLFSVGGMLSVSAQARPVAVLVLVVVLV